MPRTPARTPRHRILAEPSPELRIPALQLKREWSPWPEFGSDPGNPRELGWCRPRKHPCRDPGLRSSCVSPTPQLKREYDDSYISRFPFDHLRARRIEVVVGSRETWSLTVSALKIGEISGSF